jgi:hypothetical protein
MSLIGQRFHTIVCSKEPTAVSVPKANHTIIGKIGVHSHRQMSESIKDLRRLPE